MTTEFVCPLLGYKEFLHADWVVQILSWQKPNGCWGDDDRPAKSRLDQRDQSEQQLRVTMTNDDQAQRDVDVDLKPPVFRTRHLLYEKSLSGNDLQLCSTFHVKL